MLTGWKAAAEVDVPGRGTCRSTFTGFTLTDERSSVTVCWQEPWVLFQDSDVTLGRTRTLTLSIGSHFPAVLYSYPTRCQEPETEKNRERERDAFLHMSTLCITVSLHLLLYAHSLCTSVLSSTDGVFASAYDIG